MINFKIVVIFLLFYVYVDNIDPMIKNADTYGPYSVSFEQYVTCKGPKSRNLTLLNIEFDYSQVIGNENFTFYEDTKIDEIKITFYKLIDEKKDHLWTLKLDNPCKHYAIAAMIKHGFKTTNCIVKKGQYYIITRYKEIMHRFKGDSFFYGTYSYRADVLSKKGNIACIYATFNIKKI